MDLMHRFSLYAYGFHREWRVDTSSTPFYIDFANPQLRLAVEIDGAAYHSGRLDVVRDLKRDEYLAEHGWRVLRYSYGEVRDSARRVQWEVWHHYDKLNTPFRRAFVLKRIEQEKSGRGHKTVSAKKAINEWAKYVFNMAKRQLSEWRQRRQE